MSDHQDRGPFFDDAVRLAGEWLEICDQTQAAARELGAAEKALQLASKKFQRARDRVDGLTLLAIVKRGQIDRATRNNAEAQQAITLARKARVRARRQEEP